MKLRALRIAFAAGLLMTAATAPAQAPGEAYPARLIRLVVPFPPGGAVDILGRALSEKLSAAFKHPVIVENRPGAGTLVAAEIVAKAPGDGYTLLLGTVSTFGISPNLYAKSPVDPLRDFTQICRLGSTTLFLVASPSFPAKTVREMIELARANPGRFNYGSVGSGSIHHLFMEALKKDAGLDIEHVPYKGGVLALPDVISGKVQVMMLDASIAVPNIQSGKINALGTTAAMPNTFIASVPPIAATVPGYDWIGWMSLAGPAGMPRAVVTRIADEIRRFQATSEYGVLLHRLGMEPVEPLSPEQLSEFVKKDLVRWAAAVKASGARID